MGRVAGFIAPKAEDHVVTTITPRPANTKILGLLASRRSQLVKTRDRIFHLKEYASHHDADLPLHWFGGVRLRTCKFYIGRPAAAVGGAASFFTSKRSARALTPACPEFFAIARRTGRDFVPTTYRAPGGPLGPAKTFSHWISGYVLPPL